MKSSTAVATSLSPDEFLPRLEMMLACLEECVKKNNHAVRACPFLFALVKQSPCLPMLLLFQDNKPIVSLIKVFFTSGEQSFPSTNSIQNIILDLPQHILWYLFLN